MFFVKDLLSLKTFQGATVLAGNKGLGRTVGSISIMEVPDIEDYVEEGDFLLSTLFPFADDPEGLRTLIPRLSKAGLSGIGIKLNRYVSLLPKELERQAQELDFPVLILPGNSNFSMQINEQLKETLNRKSMELEHRNRIHTYLMELMLEGKGQDGLASGLARLLDKDVLLLGADMRPMAEHRSHTETGLGEEELARLVRSPEPGYPDYLRAAGEAGAQMAYQVRFGRELTGYIVVFGAGDCVLDDSERMAMEQFAIVFQIIIQNQKVIEDMEHRYVEEFTCDMLFGKIDSDETAKSRARALGWELRYPISVFLADVQQLSQSNRSRTELDRRMEQEVKLSSGLGENCFCAGTGRFFVILMDEVAAGSYRRIAGGLERLLDQLGVEHYAMGLSRPASTLAGVAQGYREAKRTLEIAHMMGGRRILHYKDIGVYRILQNADNWEEMAAFCEDTIGPVIRYDREHGAELLQTLQMLLECGGSLKETSEKMFLHYNTVRYRHRLIRQLLERRVDQGGMLTDIDLAIKIYNLTKK